MTPICTVHRRHEWVNPKQYEDFVVETCIKCGVQRRYFKGQARKATYTVIVCTVQSSMQSTLLMAWSDRGHCWMFGDEVYPPDFHLEGN